MYRDNDEAAKLRAAALEQERDGLLDRIKQIEKRLDAQEEKITEILKRIDLAKNNIYSKTENKNGIIDVVLDLDDNSKGYLSIQLKFPSNYDEKNLLSEFENALAVYDDLGYESSKEKAIKCARKLCFFSILSCEIQNAVDIESDFIYKKENKEMFFRKYQGASSSVLNWLEKKSLLFMVAKQILRANSEDLPFTKEEQWGPLAP